MERRPQRGTRAVGRRVPGGAARGGRHRSAIGGDADPVERDLRISTRRRLPHRRGDPADHAVVDRRDPPRRVRRSGPRRCSPVSCPGERVGSEHLTPPTVAFAHRVAHSATERANTGEALDRLRTGLRRAQPSAQTLAAAADRSPVHQGRSPASGVSTSRVLNNGLNLTLERAPSGHRDLRGWRQHGLRDRRLGLLPLTPAAHVEPSAVPRTCGPTACVTPRR